MWRCKFISRKLKEEEEVVAQLANTSVRSKVKLRATPLIEAFSVETTPGKPPGLHSCIRTWDLENEVVSHRVAGPPLLNDHTGQEVIVVNGDGAMVVDYECRAHVRDLLHPVDFIT